MSTALPETQVTQMTTARNDAGRAGTKPPARAASLTGRPTCLIYRIDQWWVLERDGISAWTDGAVPPGVFHTFRALPLAISFAESRGLDYRIIHPKPLFLETRRKRIARLRRARKNRATLQTTHLDA